MWLPSPTSLVLVIRLVGFVALAYYLSLHRLPTLRGIFAAFLLMIGMLGAYEGFVAAVHEDSRSRYGQVVPGVVVDMFQSNGEGRTYTPTGREGPHPGTSGFLITEGFARLVAYGSARTRMVDYRFPCAAGRNGTCYERDYVSCELYDRLSPGSHVNVRRAEGEATTARLDENPQWAVAIWQMAFASVFLAGAGLLSGRLKLRRRAAYVTAPAVVMAVEPVEYRDAKRWKVRFAYFDAKGEAQESADEVSQPDWKQGDNCVAVFHPEEPGLATLQARPSA
jgi:hypothetical protein